MVKALDLLAALASHVDLDMLDETARDHLLIDAWAILGRGAIEVTGATVDNDAGWHALREFHRELRTVLATLFRAGASHEEDGLPRLRFSVKLDVPLGDTFPSAIDRVAFGFDDPANQLIQFLKAALLIAIHSDPFPIRDCLHCHRLFVRGTDIRRLYCSRTCTMREADRRRSLRPALRALNEEAIRWQKANPGWRERRDAQIEAALAGALTPQAGPPRKSVRKPPSDRRVALKKPDKSAS